MNDSRARLQEEWHGGRWHGSVLRNHHGDVLHRGHVVARQQVPELRVLGGRRNHVSVDSHFQEVGGISQFVHRDRIE